MQPKVQILLSIYKPNEEFLKKQLISIDNQDYENLEVLIHDDAASIEPCDINIFKKYLTKVPYRILPYQKQNLGYCKAFEYLTKESDGDYIAFCDQDDIWMPNKISRSIEVLKEEGSLLVASERAIIDGNDNIIKERSRTGSHKNYDNWHSFDDITKYTSIICYAVGMSMVMDGKFLRSTIPFSPATGHDNWALICASTEGRVSFVDEVLVQYRRHGNNVSGTLVGINNKKDYYEDRIKPNLELLDDIMKKYPDHKDFKEMSEFINARKNHNVFKLFKYRHLAPDVAMFDIVSSLLPDFLFKFLIVMARKL